MAAKNSKRSATVPRYPERKWGPFHGGVSVCVWLNEADTEEGKRFFRSVTISPRRFRDPKTGEWEDASSFRTTDLASLILALEAAARFVATTPLPGPSVDGEEPMPNGADNDGEIPI